MARTGKPAGNKKTSFGKRTGAEKSFRDRKKETRGESSERSGRGKFSGPSKFSSSRFDKDKPRGEGRTSFGAKPATDRPFRKKPGAGFRRDGEGSAPGFKREGGNTSPRENRFSRPGNFSKPRFDSDKPRGEGKSSFGRKSDAGPFRDSKGPRSFTRKRDDDKNQSTGDRRFSKKESGFSSDREKKFSKPFVKRKEGEDRFSKFKKENENTQDLSITHLITNLFI